MGGHAVRGSQHLVVEVALNGRNPGGLALGGRPEGASTLWSKSAGSEVSTL